MSGYGISQADMVCSEFTTLVYVPCICLSRHLHPIGQSP